MKQAITLALVVAVAGACTRSVQAWPPAIIPGTAVYVRFAEPRLVVFERGRLRDSVAAVRELNGSVFSLHNNVLVLSVANRQSGNAAQSGGGERLATIALDQSTLLTTSEIDGWKFAYALLAGCVLIFVAAVMSGS